jgi:hypothetical protein
MSSAVMIFHLLAPMNISAHLSASFKVHEILSLLNFTISCLYSFKSLRESDIIPLESEKIMF